MHAASLLLIAKLDTNDDETALLEITSVHSILHSFHFHCQHFIILKATVKINLYTFYQTMISVSVHSQNLRAQMYSIDQGDRLKIKKIAGRIVPAIATTTAAVSGLVTIEMIKVLGKAPLHQLKNCFLNLALPMVLLSEPGPVQKTVLR